MSVGRFLRTRVNLVLLGGLAIGAAVVGHAHAAGVAVTPLSGPPETVIEYSGDGCFSVLGATLGTVRVGFMADYGLSRYPVPLDTAEVATDGTFSGSFVLPDEFLADLHPEGPQTVALQPGPIRLEFDCSDRQWDSWAQVMYTVTVAPDPSPSPNPVPAPTYTRTAPYTAQGTHEIAGRQWRTTCEPYSQTERCRAEIWASTVKRTGSTYAIERDWAFNNLTYLPFMKQSQWAHNPLGRPGTFKSADGAQWRTECNTATTGGNGCRSYRLSTVYSATPKAGGGYTFGQENTWVFNNIVMFGGYSR